MGHIRPLEEKDLPALASLRRNLFKATSRQAPGELEDYLKRVFLRSPFFDPNLQSLVYDDGGEPVAFIGIIPHPMVLGAETIRGCVSTQFMVAPAVRGLVSIQMLRHLFGGPQDLTYADACPNAMRKMWIGSGGVTAWPQSMMWEVDVVPDAGQPRSKVQALGRAFGSALPGPAKRVVTRLTSSAVAPVPTDRAEPADIVALASKLIDARLRPVYREDHLAWLVQLAGEKRGGGPIRFRIVRGNQGESIGWFVYRAPRRGAGFVFQVAAAAADGPRVLMALAQDAWREEVSTLRGGAEPNMLAAYEAVGWPVIRRGPWAMAHSTRPDLLAAVARGDTWLTGLDGERLLSF